LLTKERAHAAPDEARERGVEFLHARTGKVSICWPSAAAAACRSRALASASALVGSASGDAPLGRAARSSSPLADPTNADADAKARDLQAAAAALGQQIETFPVRGVQEFDAAFAGLVRRGVRALLVSNEVLFTSHRDQVVALAARHASRPSTPIRSSPPPAAS